MEADTALTRLLALRARTSHQLRFLVYSVDRSDEVGVLFETVNGRGKDLTELERVKNYRRAERSGSACLEPLREVRLAGMRNTFGSCGWTAREWCPGQPR